MAKKAVCLLGVLVLFWWWVFVVVVLKKTNKQNPKPLGTCSQWDKNAGKSDKLCHFWAFLLGT